MRHREWARRAPDIQRRPCSSRLAGFKPVGTGSTSLALLGTTRIFFGAPDCAGPGRNPTLAGGLSLARARNDPGFDLRAPIGPAARRDVLAHRAGAARGL